MFISAPACWVVCKIITTNAAACAPEHQLDRFLDRLLLTEREKPQLEYSQTRLWREKEATGRPECGQKHNRVFIWKGCRNTSRTSQEPSGSAAWAGVHSGGETEVALLRFHLPPTLILYNPKINTLLLYCVSQPCGLCLCVLYLLFLCTLGVSGDKNKTHVRTCCFCFEMCP